MTQDIEIPKISQKHLLGIKYLSIDDINKILELAIFFKLKNKEKNKNYPILTGRTINAIVSFNIFGTLLSVG